MMHTTTARLGVSPLAIISLLAAKLRLSFLRARLGAQASTALFASLRKPLAPLVHRHRLVAHEVGDVEPAVGRLGGLAAAAIEDLARGVGLRTFRLGTPHEFRKLLDRLGTAFERQPLDAEHVLWPAAGITGLPGDEWSPAGLALRFWSTRFFGSFRGARFRCYFAVLSKMIGIGLFWWPADEHAHHRGMSVWWGDVIACGLVEELTCG
jgi:hypothetical protein